MAVAVRQPRRVVTDRVILATNAIGPGVARRLARTVVPLSVYQIATAPMPADIVRRIAPQRQPMSDMRSNLFTYRLDRDDRLISGGMAIVPLGAHRRMARAIVARLAAELRLPAVPEVAYVWRGTAAMTPDFLPHLYEFGPGIVGGIGCNGRGIRGDCHARRGAGRCRLRNAARRSSGAAGGVASAAAARVRRPRQPPPRWRMRAGRIGAAAAA